MQISRAVMSNVTVSLASLIAVLAAGIALHFLFLAFNITATQVLRLGETAGNSGTALPLPGLDRTFVLASVHSKHVLRPLP